MFIFEATVLKTDDLLRDERWLEMQNFSTKFTKITQARPKNTQGHGLCILQ